MHKVVINICYGRFRLSRQAILRAREIADDPKWGGPSLEGDVFPDGRVSTMDGFVEVPRTDPILVQVVEELGKDANGQWARLQVIAIDAGRAYRINDYDGAESIEYRDEIDWTIAGD